MAQAKGWTPHLKYSPVNRIIVNWAHENQPFSMCGMPTVDCPGPSPVPPDPEPCMPTSAQESIDLYDWFRWVPEVIAGMAGASDDMAASYVRRAAIDFTRRTRVLHRVSTVELQPGVYRYPVESFEGESVQGVLRAETALGCCTCEVESGPVNLGLIRFDRAKSEIVLTPNRHACGCHMDDRGPRFVAFTLWAAPTEDSCKHDVYLYEQYRREITLGARAWLSQEVTAFGTYRTNSGAASFRGDGQVLQLAAATRAEYEREVARARNDAALEGVTSAAAPMAGGLFGGCCAIGGFRR